MSQREVLLDILDRQALYPLFQPIIDLHQGNVIGYEGLIRGPTESALHFPLDLFRAAEDADLTVRLEMLCIYIVMTRFMETTLPGRLFVNISPFALLAGALSDPLLADFMDERSGLAGRVVFEITEGSPHMDNASVVAGLMRLRDRGFKIALDDLGEGFSSLRLWSDVRPDYVKLDKHFVTGIDKDPVKLQFVRSIGQIAKKSNAIIIAEGIEHRAEFLILKEMGICLGQGYFIGRPVIHPERVPSEAAQACLRDAVVSVASWSKTLLQHGRQARLLLNEVPTVTVATMSEDALKVLLVNPELNVLPVLDGKVPVGLLSRAMVDKFSHGYVRDLYSRKSCTFFMEKLPLIVDVEMSIIALSQLVLQQGQKRFADGFILVRDGVYAGVGSNFALMQEMTKIQIQEARYANPLTMLPGNVPINEQIEMLLSNSQRFCACYVDLDWFKPFNDMFGYGRGDELIKLTAKVLMNHADSGIDFVGHIGGDDFFVLFQSPDWELRCKAILREFDNVVQSYIQQENLGGDCYIAEDRRGHRAEYCFPTLSIGAVPVGRGQFTEHHEIAAATAEVKKAAKKILGSSLFVDQRETSIPQSRSLVAA